MEKAVASPSITEWRSILSKNPVENHTRSKNQNQTLILFDSQFDTIVYATSF